MRVNVDIDDILEQLSDDHPNTKTKAVLQFTPDEARTKSQRKEYITDLMKIEQNLTMSTREIAELTNKRHDNVVVDTRKMLRELYGDGGKLLFLSTYTNNPTDLSQLNSK